MQIIVPVITRSNQSTPMNKTLEKGKSTNEHMSKCFSTIWAREVLWLIIAFTFEM